MNKVLSIALLLGLMACEGEVFEEGGSAVSPLGEGTYVIDYVPEESRTKAVSQDPLPAKKRIKSLTYLLYDEAGNFVKRRDIPDMANMSENAWPMKRETMTWAQREALKDTLQQGNTYYAVFVANAKKAQFNEEEVLHLTEQQSGEEVYVTLDEVYLSLPTTTAFGDDNMFYLAVQYIEPNPVGADRDTPYNCPVTLRRIVSRTDFMSGTYPAWDTDEAKNLLRPFTDGLYKEFIAIPEESEASKGAIAQSIAEGLEAFADGFANYAEDYPIKIPNPDYNVETNPNVSQTISDEGYITWVTSFCSAVKALDKTIIEKLEDINVSEKTDAITLEEALQNELFELCCANTQLSALWRPWTGLRAKVKYNSRAARFYLMNTTAESEEAEEDNALYSPFLEVSDWKVTTGDAENLESETKQVFTLIGFGENTETTPDAEAMNKMESLHFYESENDETEVFSLSLPENMRSFNGQGTNVRVRLAYQPIQALNYNEANIDMKEFVLTNIPLEDYLDENLKSQGNTEGQYLKEVEKYMANLEGKPYGETLKVFQLTIKLPDLSVVKTEETGGALIIESKWTLVE